MKIYTYHWCNFIIYLLNGPELFIQIEVFGEMMVPQLFWYIFYSLQKMTVTISPKHEIATDDNDNETCCSNSKVSELTDRFLFCFVA